MEKRYYENVVHQFTKDELFELGTALAREEQTAIDLRAEKASISASLNASIKEAEKSIASLTRKITSGSELRETECLVYMDTPRPGMKEIRTLLSNEYVREEPMTTEEMQTSFGFSDPERSQ